jgi:hypothetical protein
MSADDGADDGERVSDPAPRGDAGTGSPAEDPATPSRRPVLRWMLISLGVLGLVLAVVAGGGLWFLSDRYAGNIDRVADVFNDLDDETRPAPASPAEERGKIRSPSCWSVPTRAASRDRASCPTAGRTRSCWRVSRQIGSTRNWSPSRETHGWTSPAMDATRSTPAMRSAVRRC